MTSIILALDLGSINTGVCVLGETVQLSDVWVWEEELPRLAVLLRQKTRRILRQYHVDILAVERWTWFGAYAKESEKQLRMLGALETVCDEVVIEAIPPKEWQTAIVGRAPIGMARGWSTPAWKRTVRGAVERQLQARGLMWDFGTDVGSHKADACGLAIFVRDMLMRQRRIVE